MDEALVENAKHDVDDQDGQKQQHTHALERRLEGIRSTAETRADRRWQADAPLQAHVTSSMAVPSDTPGARLNDSVTAGSWPWWLIVKGATLWRERVTVLSGIEPAVFVRT